MNYELRTTNCESQATSHERRGFTLVEMVVAIGLLVVMVLFAGTIFKASISSYRVAMAQAEIMRKLRVITEQLNSDFQGLRKDAPMFIWFQKGSNGPDDANRFDQIMFFADGDFQSTKQYPYIKSDGTTGFKTIIGNVARIYYGQTQNTYGLEARYRLLARRQHISTVDTDILLSARWPDSNSASFAATFDSGSNDTYEYDWVSLSQWQALANDTVYGSTNVNQIIAACFDIRPTVDLANANGLHMLMTEGVGSFSVQWSYSYTNVSTGQKFIYWWPSDDPNGDGDSTDSDFSRMPTNPFGFYFNVAAPSFTNWFSYGGAIYLAGAVVEPIWPKAMKFTFTLYDSRGVFKEGQTFTHIVYLGD
jgi:prepilin-type N-terminal cleavage/methylation domain-containing protein